MSISSLKSVGSVLFSRVSIACQKIAKIDLCNSTPYIITAICIRAFAHKCVHSFTQTRIRSLLALPKAFDKKFDKSLGKLDPLSQRRQIFDRIFAAFTYMEKECSQLEPEEGHRAMRENLKRLLEELYLSADHLFVKWCCEDRGVRLFDLYSQLGQALMDMNNSEPSAQLLDRLESVLSEVSNHLQGAAEERVQELECRLEERDRQELQQQLEGLGETLAQRRENLLGRWNALQLVNAQQSKRCAELDRQMAELAMGLQGISELQQKLVGLHMPDPQDLAPQLEEWLLLAEPYNSSVSAKQQKAFLGLEQRLKVLNREFLGLEHLNLVGQQRVQLHITWSREWRGQQRGLLESLQKQLVGLKNSQISQQKKGERVLLMQQEFQGWWHNEARSVLLRNVLFLIAWQKESMPQMMVKIREYIQENLQPQQSWFLLRLKLCFILCLYSIKRSTWAFNRALTYQVQASQITKQIQTGQIIERKKHVAILRKIELDLECISHCWFKEFDPIDQSLPRLFLLTTGLPSLLTPQAFYWMLSPRKATRAIQQWVESQIWQFQMARYHNKLIKFCFVWVFSITAHIALIQIGRHICGKSSIKALISVNT